MKYFLYPLLILLFPLFTNAQSNYKPGYVVNVQGDTVKGYINYREWANNPLSVDFKETADGGSSVAHTAENALAFGVNNIEHYESHTVWISQDAIGTVTVGLDTSRIRKTVFLKLLSAGARVNLYQYTDEVKARYYIKEATGSEPKELAYYSYRGADYILVTSTRYKAQLNQLLQKYNPGNKSIERKILGARYSASDMAKIVQLINGETAGNTQPSQAGTRFYAGAGVNYASLNVTGFSSFTSDKTTIKNNPLPIIQAGIDVFANKNVKRVVFRAEVSYTQNKHEISAPLKMLADVTGEANLNYTQKIFGVSPQILFAAYNANTVKVYLLGGMTWNFMSYGDYAYTTTYTDPNYNREYKQTPSFVKSGISFIGKVNVSFKRFEVFAGLAPRMVYTKVIGYSFSNNTYQAGFNWYITK